jgi:hypothetical protein
MGINDPHPAAVGGGELRKFNLMKIISESRVKVGHTLKITMFLR